MSISRIYQQKYCLKKYISGSCCNELETQKAEGDYPYFERDDPYFGWKINVDTGLSRMT